jgi:hypothetical protein
VLWTVERESPLFGSWSQTSFLVCSCLGAGGLLFLHVFSRRCVRSLAVARHSDLVQLTFFSAFTRGKALEVAVSEFQNSGVSFAGLVKSELTHAGNVWLDLENNTFAGRKDIETALGLVLSGKSIRGYLKDA